MQYKRPSPQSGDHLVGGQQDKLKKGPERGPRARALAPRPRSYYEHAPWPRRLLLSAHAHAQFSADPEAGSADNRQESGVAFLVVSDLDLHVAILTAPTSSSGFRGSPLNLKFLNPLVPPAGSSSSPPSP